MEERNLTVAQVAQIVGCHILTVKNYEERGYIQPWRDNNNHRRFSLADALKLKEIFAIRKRATNE